MSVAYSVCSCTLFRLLGLPTYLTFPAKCHNSLQKLYSPVGKMFILQPNEKSPFTMLSMDMETLVTHIVYNQPKHLHQLQSCKGSIVIITKLPNTNPRWKEISYRERSYNKDRKHMELQNYYGVSLDPSFSFSSHFLAYLKSCIKNTIGRLVAHKALLTFCMVL